MAEIFLFDKCSNLCYLTQKEYITIVATMKYAYEKEFQCDFSDKYKDHKDQTKAKLFHEKKSMCNGRISDTAPSYKHRYKHILFNTCPCNFKDNNVFRLVRLEKLFFEHGILPQNTYMDTIGNNIMHQSSKLLQAFDLIRSFLTEREIEEQKKQAEEMKRKK